MCIMSNSGTKRKVWKSMNRDIEESTAPNPILSLQEQFGSLQNARLYIPDVNAEIQTNTGTLGTQAPQTKTSVKRQHDISSCPDLLADGTARTLMLLVWYSGQTTSPLWLLSSVSTRRKRHGDCKFVRPRHPMLSGCFNILQSDKNQ